MRTLTIAAMAAAALAAGCGGHDDGDDIITGSPWYITYGNGHPIAASSSDPHVLDHEDDLLALVNGHRVSIGLPALISSGPQRDVARAHSIHMAIGDFTGLTNPEGHDPGERADIAGIPWTIYAENIEYGVHDADDVFSNWLGNTGQHDNIDDPDFVYAGVGYEHDSSSIWNNYYTMDFRAP